MLEPLARRARRGALGGRAGARDLDLAREPERARALRPVARADLRSGAAGREGPFVTRDSAAAGVVGSSRFLNVRPADRVVEIGWTWLHPSAWRSGANVEAKLLMMGHAFETLDCVRVEFKTDARNERSRAALAALPAWFEGILRNHMIVPDVGLRDSAYFSVIASEWPAVKAIWNGAWAARRPARPSRPQPGRSLTLRCSNDGRGARPLGASSGTPCRSTTPRSRPSLGPRTPARATADAWRIRLAKYERWLDDPDTFFIIAEVDGRPAGYAFVTVGMPYACWERGERLAKLETLSVLPDHRGNGVGAALLEAVWIASPSSA